MNKTIKFIKKYWYLLVLALILIASLVFFILSSRQEEALPAVEFNPLEENKVLQEEVEANIAGESEALTYYQRQDIESHNKRYDCWLAFTDETRITFEIYDVSNWDYPGQSDISPACGKINTDAEDIFKQDGISQRPPKDQFFLGYYE